MIATANTQQHNNTSTTQQNAQHASKQARKERYIQTLYYNKVTAQAPTQATAQKTSWTQHKRQRKTGNNQRAKNGEGNKRFSFIPCFSFPPGISNGNSNGKGKGLYI